VQNEDFISAFTTIMGIIHDLTLDIPNAGVQLGACLGYCCSEQVLPKNFLQQIGQLPDLKQAAAEKILNSAFKAAIKAKDFANAQSLWEANSGIHTLFDQAKLQALKSK